MAAHKLTEEEITQHLSHLPGWSRHEQQITRRYEFRDFVHSLEFVNAIGRAAEDVQHHPDMDIRYNRVRLTLTTHDSAGLTLLDMEMAGAADGAADVLGGA